MACFDSIIEMLKIKTSNNWKVACVCETGLIVVNMKYELSTQVRDWVYSISRDWKFKRIIPAHFAAPVNASNADFRAAFAFLDELLGEQFVSELSLSLLFSSIMGKAASYFPPDDMRTLSSLDQFLVSVGAVKKTVSGRKR